MFPGFLADKGDLFQLPILDHGFRLKPLQCMLRGIQKQILEMMVMRYHDSGSLGRFRVIEGKNTLIGWFFLKEFREKIK